jgi:hypothetical protein
MWHFNFHDIKTVNSKLTFLGCLIFVEKASLGICKTSYDLFKINIAGKGNLTYHKMSPPFHD